MFNSSQTIPTMNAGSIVAQDTTGYKARTDTEARREELDWALYCTRQRLRGLACVYVLSSITI